MHEVYEDIEAWYLKSALQDRIVARVSPFLSHGLTCPLFLAWRSRTHKGCGVGVSACGRIGERGTRRL
jgi:hypothetical protein